MSLMVKTMSLMEMTKSCRMEKTMSWMECKMEMTKNCRMVQTISWMECKMEMTMSCMMEMTMSCKMEMTMNCKKEIAMSYMMGMNRMIHKMEWRMKRMILECSEMMSNPMIVLSDQ